MPFVEDPSYLSKSRLKSDLVAHNVALPSAASKKEVYVELHLRHIDQTNAADFSSDEDDQVHDVAGDDPADAEKPDPNALTDKDLKALLLKYGVKAGPIVASTRAVYENKLRKLLQSNGKKELNEAENAVLYSDSDEEGEEKEEREEESEVEQEKTAEALKPNQQQNNERPCRHRNNECSSKKNSRNALKSSERTETHRSQIPAGFSKVSSIAEHSGLRSGISQEPVKDILKDIFPDIRTTPTGIYATARRPIKGAAQRPIQYEYPNTPVSPTTLERQEVERRLVPIYVQILVFFTVVCVLYFIFVNVEDGSSVVAFLESLNQWPDGKEGFPLLDEKWDVSGEL